MKLLEAGKLGNLTLKNRMIMAAMTRSRADVNGIVQPMTVEYYKQRASAGMILSEAINISKDAIGSPLTPGLFTEEQIEAWKKVTEAVHKEGGIIFAQLWHTGRIGHSIDRNGVLPSAPSAIRIENGQQFTAQGMKDYETPRAMVDAAIKQTIEDYKQAAINAMSAGFDGVEVHAGNGYLLQQFMSDNTNQRNDEYGGSIENKCRLTLEVMKTLIYTIGGDKVGIKISPFQAYGNVICEDPIKTYSYLLDELAQLDFAFVELMKKNFPLEIPHYPKGNEIELLGKKVKQMLIANTGYTKDSAEAELQKGIADFISFGALFLANPDLPKRFKENAPLNIPDKATMFGGDEKGYIDYPILDK